MIIKTIDTARLYVTQLVGASYNLALIKRRYTVTKAFKIVSSELDREFQIHNDKGQFVALAPTARPHSSANWDNKKIAPKALWESVSTEQERSAILKLLDEPGLTKASAMLKLADLQITFSSTQRATRKRPNEAESDGPSL